MQPKKTHKRAKREPAASPAQGPTGIRSVPQHTAAPYTLPASAIKEKHSSYEIFNVSIARATNLLRIHQAAHGRQAKPEKYLADAHRAAIVLAIAALDAFVRTLIIGKVRELLAAPASLPESLCTLIKKFLKDDQLLEAARQSDLQDRVEKALQNDFEKRSFQGTRVISEYMEMVGHRDIFHEISIKANLSEDTLKTRLDSFTQRRHIIAHRGDHDLNQNPPTENKITKSEAKDCIKLVSQIAQYIHEIGNKR